MARTGRAVLLTLLVITSVLAGAVSPVAATHGQCSELDEFFWVLSFGTVNQQCDSDQISHEMQTIIDSEDNQTHLDLYEGMVGQSESYETSTNALESYREDTRTTAFIKGENATIAGIRAGESKTAINTSARTAVHDYYTESQEIRTLEAWNVLITQMEYVHNRAANETGVAPSDLWQIDWQDGTDAENTISASVTGYGSRSVTLINGSTYSVRTVTVQANYEFSTATDITVTHTIGPYDGDKQYYFDASGSGMGTHTDYVTGFSVKPPTGSSLSTVSFVDLSADKARLDAQGTTSAQVADNVGVYSGTLYDAEQAGTINATEYVSPYVMAQEWSTDYNSTGYWSYAVAMLSASGLEAPDLNSTGQMTVKYNGLTYDGILMSSETPGKQWNTSQVYNGSEIAGYQWFITLDGERLELQDEFTLTAMEDKNGTAINSTQTVKYVYQSNNVTEFQELQKQVLALQKQIEEREPTGAGGGAGGSSGFWPPFGLSEAQAAIGAAVVLGGGALSMSQRGRR